MDNRAIGVFDSGVGGLTVANTIMQALPNERIIYYGDAARLPYGTKSKETIIKYSAEITRFLVDRNVKIIVIACNSASSNAYDYLTAHFDLPIVEVVSAGVSECLKKVKKITGVIGTRSTVDSGAYDIISKINPAITVYQKACPLFVPLAEEGWGDSEIALQTAEIYLGELLEKNIDTLLLACTHYPLLLNTIKKVTPDVCVVNPAKAVAKKVKAVLTDNNMLADSPGEHEFILSDTSPAFEYIKKKLFLDNTGFLKT